MFDPINTALKEVFANLLRPMPYRKKGAKLHGAQHMRARKHTTSRTGRGLRDWGRKLNGVR